MRKTIILAALMFSSIISYAQGQKWINNVKLSGFGIVQYQYNGMHNSKTSKSNSFNLRLGRVSLDGRILDDWYWKAQLQVNGNNYYGAVWSADGNNIAFSVFNNKSVWKIGSEWRSLANWSE